MLKTNYIKAGGGTCADANIEVNGNSFATVPSGDTLPITVEYETSLDNPIQSISGNNIIITDPVVVATPIIYLRPIGTGQLTSYADGDDYWKVANGVDTYIPPTVGKPALLDKQKMWKLVSDNVFGHKFRYTSSIGGYYDPETSTYHLADGTTTVKATAFPNDYRRDHHTGLGWINNFYTLTWLDCFTFLDTYTNAGYSDFFMPNLGELQTLPDFGKHWQFYDFPPLDNTGPNQKWSSTTDNNTPLTAYMISITGSVGNGVKTGLRYLIPMRYHND